MPPKPFRARPFLAYGIDDFMLSDPAWHCLYCPPIRGSVEIQLAGYIDLSGNDGMDDGNDVFTPKGKEIIYPLKNKPLK